MLESIWKLRTRTKLRQGKYRCDNRMQNTLVLNMNKNDYSRDNLGTTDSQLSFGLTQQDVNRTCLLPMDNNDILFGSGRGSTRIGCGAHSGSRSGRCSGRGGGRGRSRRTTKQVPRATAPLLAIIHTPLTNFVRLFPVCTPVPTTSTASTTFCYPITTSGKTACILIRSAVRGLVSCCAIYMLRILLLGEAWRAIEVLACIITALRGTASSLILSIRNCA